MSLCYMAYPLFFRCYSDVIMNILRINCVLDRSISETSSAVSVITAITVLYLRKGKLVYWHESEYCTNVRNPLKAMIVFLFLICL
jgi:hypothetical protein